MGLNEWGGLNKWGVPTVVATNEVSTTYTLPVLNINALLSNVHLTTNHIDVAYTLPSLIVNTLANNSSPVTHAYTIVTEYVNVYTIDTTLLI